MSIFEFHLAYLHDLQLRGELLNLLLQLLVLLVQVGRLLVRHAHAVERVGGGQAAGAQLIVPEVALALDHPIELRPKDENHSHGCAQLGAYKAKKIFNIWTRVWEDEDAVGEGRERETDFRLEKENI